MQLDQDNTLARCSSRSNCDKTQSPSAEDGVINSPDADGESTGLTIANQGSGRPILLKRTPLTNTVGNPGLESECQEDVPLDRLLAQCYRVACERARNVREAVSKLHVSSASEDGFRT